MGLLTESELKYLRKNLARDPNDVEKNIVAAEWSEHCSYKSSKSFIKLFPTKGKRVIVGPGYDAGVLDVGGGQVLTIHIESHNHPSAIEPYGGSATGVGGVLRDIMSMGTRPIALMNALRFAPIYKSNGEYPKSKWLFKNVVKGIADYGNCMGIPTVAGDVEFDRSFEDYCLVDVACVGTGKRENIISNHADIGDLVILVGGSTGRDGIHGASFASKMLDEDNRSAVQIPDPFLEKLLLEATVEATGSRCVKAIKDLGGGGLACCLSETSDNLGKGFKINLDKVFTKEDGMSASEIMISESQERMLFITDSDKFRLLEPILQKYDLRYSVIGHVVDHKDLEIEFRGKLVAQMPSHLVAHAPLLYRDSKIPSYIEEIQRAFVKPEEPLDLNPVLLSMLSNPSIADKKWIYGQFDHEVGLRTVMRPGHGDASVLRLDNDKYVAIKLDGNSKHCFLNPYQGTLGCLSESRRNIICCGAEPIGIVDHLQYGDPEDPEVFWGFAQSVNAIVEYCKFMQIPVVGGKVSLHNKTKRGSIKPSPVIGTVGLIEKKAWITDSRPKDGDTIYIIGKTHEEMGGSEYYEYYHGKTGGSVPKLDLETDRENGKKVSQLIQNDYLNSVHDCSKGGLAVALAEMAIAGKVGMNINLDCVPNSCYTLDSLAFSESHSRYVISTQKPDQLENLMKKSGHITFAKIGNALSSTNDAYFLATSENKKVINMRLDKLVNSWSSLENNMDKI
jgi:phosphoribosylformylglycinamidine synthase